MKNSTNLFKSPWKLRIVLSFLFLAIWSNSLKAQLDYIHYIPPFYAGSINSSPSEGYGSSDFTSSYTYPDGHTVFRGNWCGDQMAVLTTPNTSDNPITVIVKNGKGVEIGRIINLHADNPQMFHLGSIFNNSNAVSSETETKLYNNTWQTPNDDSWIFTRILYWRYDMTNGWVKTYYNVTDPDNIPTLGNILQREFSRTKTVPIGVVLASKLNKPLATDGLIFESLANANGKKQPFYVNIRHKTRIHGFSLTSKGQAALGTNFYSGHLRGLAGMKVYQSHFISVMATEDNTSVTFENDRIDKITGSNDSGDEVIGVSKISLSFNKTVSVTLAKGESYVFAIDHHFLNSENEIADFNGTHIKATKPIVVNTGSWCASLRYGYQDIGIDQIVPTGALGKEYVVIKGDGGRISTGEDLERPLVVATVDNTQIFLNRDNIGTPDFILAKAGDSRYIQQSNFNGEVMYIKSSQDIYMYQPTSSQNNAANVGFNFIPPLTALGLRQVNIPFINQVGVGKILITAMNGENVYMNGNQVMNPMPALGSLDDSRWWCYTISNVPDNVVITSKKTIAVALTVKDNVVGAAGYFSGFTKFISPLDPDIDLAPDKDLSLFCKTSGDNIVLAPDASSDFVDVYRWYSKSVSPANFLGSDPYIVKPVAQDQVYFLQSFYADPYLDIYNYGDFDNDLAFWSTDYDDEAGTFEGKYEVARLVKDPKQASSNYISIVDYSTNAYPSMTGNMLLLSCGRSVKEIWKSDGIPVDANEDYIFKAHGIYVEEDLGKGQVLQLYVNNTPVGKPLVLDNPDHNNDGKYTVDDWQSFAGVWNSGSETQVSLSIKNLKTNVYSAIALDRISFSRAIKKEASIEVAVSPPVVDPGMPDQYSFCKGYGIDLDASSPDSHWFTYSWTRLGGAPIVETNITGKNTPILHIANATIANEGVYEVQIEGSSACGKDNGDNMTFTTNVVMTQPVKFNTPEFNTILCEGRNVEFDLSAASGGINNIQWYKNDIAIDGTNGVGLGATALRYTYTADIADENPTLVNIKCIISGTCPDVEWNSNVDVLEGLRITNQLYIDKYEFCEDENILLKVGVSGAGNFTYKWLHSGILLGTTTVPEFSLIAQKSLEGANYSVIITTDNSCDPISSDLVNAIRVNDKVKITGKSETGSSCEGAEHIFTLNLLDVSISSKYTYQWYHNNIIMPGKVNSFLAIESLSLSDTGSYKVVVTNSCNSEERTFNITVKPKPKLISGITASPTGDYCSTQKVTLRVETNAFVDSFTWTLADGTKRTTIVPVLILDPIGAISGEYSVQASNACSASLIERINLNIKSDLNVWISDVQICDGENQATLVVSGNATSFQWYKGNGATRKIIVGATAASHTILNPVFGTDNGIYTCDVAGSVCGTKTLSLILTMNKVISSDIEKTVCAGTDNTLSVTAVGDYTYQWYKIINPDTVYKIIVGETSNTISINDVQFVDNGLYKCILTSIVCAKKEIIGRLTVLRRTEVNSFPSTSINLCSTDELRISPSFVGNINSIKWYKDDILLPAFNELKQLYIANISSADSGKYKVIVQGDCGDVTKSADVQVYDPISFAEIIKNISICENANLSITPDVNGTVASYQWYFNNTAIPGQTNNKLSINKVSISDTGLYKLVVSSVSCSSNEIVFDVSVRESLVLSGLGLYSPVLCAGESLILSPDVIGDALSYSWSFKGKEISTAKVLKIDKFNIINQGKYTLNISSDYSCGTDLTLTSNPKLADELTIITNLDNLDVCFGDKAEFSIIASGNGNLTYQWRKNGNIIPGETNSTFVIPAVDMSHDNNFYSVDIKDDCSGLSVLSSNQALLSVFEKTTISTQPITKTILENADVELSVSTEGNTKVNYQWQKKNGAGAFVNIISVSAKTNKLLLSNLSLADNNSEYKVLISSSNFCDSDLTSDVVKIFVRQRIKITSNIGNISICENENAVLSVTTNITDATYQWKIIIGTVSTDLTNSALYQNVNSRILTIVNPDDSYEVYKYICYIDGGSVSGNITSETAQITVNKIPSLDIIADQTICSDASLNINISADADNISNYELIFPDGTSRLFNVAKIILANADIQEGEYTLKVSASCGTPERKFNISFFPDLNITNFDSSPICSSEGNRLFSSTPTGHGPFQYTWKKDADVLITGNANEGEKITFLLDNLSAVKSGNYSLLVTDACGFSTTVNANIIIKDPAVINNPTDENYTICSNSSKTLSIDYTGTNVNIQWFKDGLDLSKTSKSIIVTDEGKYTVKLTTDAVCAIAPEKNFTISHLVLPTSSVVADVYLCENEVATFSVIGTTYTGGNISYQWYNAAGIIAGETTDTYSFTANDALAQNLTYYYCKITDDCTLSVESNRAVLYVNTPALVTILSKDVLANELSPLDLSFTHTGMGTYIYQWSLNGTDLNNDAEYTGVKSASLHINNITADYQDRKYVCTIKNIATGACVVNTEVDRTIKLNYGNRIDTDASDATVCENTATSFNLVINASYTTSTIQWQVNKTGVDADWTNLTNDAIYTNVTTKTLSINSVSGAMSTYKYRASIDSGIQYSKSVFYNFQIKTSLEEIVGPDSICDNTELRLNSSATGHGLISYAWTLDSDPAFSANTQNIVLAALTHKEGTYTLTVNATCGSVIKLKNIVHYDNLAFTPLVGKLVCSTDSDHVLEAFVTGETNAAGVYLYTWSKDGVDLADNNATYTVVSEKSNSGLYSLTAEGMCGSITTKANVSFEDPIIVDDSKETITICNNSFATLNALATGDNIQYEWTNKLDDTNILSTDRTYDVTLVGTYVVKMTSNICASDFSKEFEIIHYDELVITQHPADLVLCVGQEAVFSASATGADHNLGILYQWYDATDSAITGETSNTYTIAAVQESDNNKSFYCKITDDCGKLLNTTVASLIVNTPAKIDLSVKTQAVNERNNIVLEANVTGLGVYLYQWKLNGTLLTEVILPLGENSYTGTTTNTLTINNVSFDINGNDYVCTVTNTAICGGAVYASRIVNVLPVDRIKTQADDVLVCEDTPASFTLVLNSPYDAPDPIYGTSVIQWQVNKTRASADWQNIDETEGYTNSKSLILGVTNVDNTKQYYTFRAIVDTGAAISDEVKFLFHQRVRITPIDNVSLCKTALLYKAVRASGSGSMTYSWTQPDGTEISTKRTILDNNTQEGEYTVTISGGVAVCPVVSEKFTLTHYEDLVIEDIADLDVCVGKDANFSIVQTAGTNLDPVNNYTWTQNGTPIVNNTNTFSITGANKAIDNGLYKVTVEAMCGIQSKSFNVAVNEDLVFTDNSIEIKIKCIGASEILDINPSGDNLTFSWTKDGVTIVDYTNKFLSVTDPAIYIVTVAAQSNCLATQISKTFDVQDKQNLNTTSVDDITVCEDDTSKKFKYTVTSVIGDNAKVQTYQWYKINTATNEYDEITGATSETYNLTAADVKADNNGDTYYCEVTDDCGKIYTSNIARLNVVPTLLVTNTSTNVTAAENGDVTFTAIVANDDPTIGYEWYVNGSPTPLTDGGNIVGATTKKLTISNLTNANNGEIYTCIVTNSSPCTDQGQAVFTLTVIPVVRITIQPRDIDVCLTTTGNKFTATIKPTLAPSPDTVLLWEVSISGSPFFALSNGVEYDGVDTEVLTVKKAISTSMISNYRYRLVADRDPVTGIAVEISVSVGFIENKAVSFLSDLSDKVLCIDADLNISAKAEGHTTTNLVYQWTLPDTNTLDSEIILVKGSDVQLGTYTISVTGGTCGPISQNINVSQFADLTFSGLTDDTEFCMSVENNQLGVSIDTEAKVGSSSFIWTGPGVSSGATSATLTINPDNLSKEGTYTVFVTDFCITKKAFTYLKIIAPINITTNLLDVGPICKDSDAEFNIVATGDARYPLSYEWKNLTTNTIVGTNDASYTINNVQTADVGQYQVSITDYNDACDDLSPVASLILSPIMTITQADPIDDCVGYEAKFSVVANNNVATPSYQWYKDDGAIDALLNPSAAEAELIITTTTMADKGYYHCEISDFCSIIISDKVLLNLFTAPELSNNATSDVLSVTEDGNAVLSVENTGAGLFTYQWKNPDGTDVTDGGRFSGAQTKELTITDVQLSDNNKEYTCYVLSENPKNCGDDNSLIRLKVKALERIDIQIKEFVLCEDTDAVFTLVSAKGISFLWQVKLKDSSTWTDISLGNADDIGVGSELTVSLVSESMSTNKYRVIVDAGLDTETISDEVGFGFKANVKLGSTLNDLSICNGEVLNINVDASGAGVLSYEWTYTHPVTSTSTIISTSESNLFYLPTPNAGTYSLSVTGECSPVTDDFILSKNVDVSITKALNNIALCVEPSASHELTVEVAPTSTIFDYKWFKNGVEITTAPNSASYSIFLASDSEAMYTVEVFDNCGSVKSSAYVDIHSRIVITEEHIDDTVCMNTNSTLSVKAVGDIDYPLSYAWTNNAGSVGNDANTYTLVNITSDDIYNVNVSVASPDYECPAIPLVTGTITVKEDFRVRDFTEVEVCEGEDTTFTVEIEDMSNTKITDLTNYTFQWLENGEEIIGETNSSLTLSDISVTKHDYNYSCKVTDACGIKHQEKLGASVLLKVFQNPTIESQDISVLVGENNQASLYVKLSGKGSFSYQWKEKIGTVYVDITDAIKYIGFDTHKLTIVSANIGQHGNLYRCVITNTASPCGEPATSKDILLKINPKTRIDVEAIDAIVCEDTAASFSITSDVGSTFQWQINKTGADTDWVDILNADTNYSGEDGRKLDVLKVELSMRSYLYRVIVDKDIALVTDGVSSAVGFEFRERAKIIGNLLAQELCPSEELNININATAYNKVSYRWTYPVVGVPTQQGKTNDPLLSLANPEDGEYILRVEGDACQTAEQSFTISHSDNISITALTSNAICENTAGLKSYDLTTTASGTPSAVGGLYTYVWKKDGVEVQTDNIPGTSSYTISGISADQEGLYSVEVFGKCESAKSEVSVVIDEPILITTNNLIDQEVCKGDNLSLSVETSGDTDYAITYVWTNIVGDILGDSKTLNLSNIQTNDTYTLNITSALSACDDKVGPVEASISIRADIVLVKEAIDGVICEGDNFTFTIGASGAVFKTGSALTYQWYKNAVAILVNGDGAEYIITDALAAQDAGSYYCVITDDCDKTIQSQQAVLVVNTKPVFTLEASDKTVLENSTVIFTSQADVIGILAYQWYESTDGGLNYTALIEGVKYVGVTSTSLTIDNVLTSYSDNKYKLVATNVDGCSPTDSKIITLTVLAETTINIVDGQQVVCDGTSVDFSVSTNVVATYQWQVDEGTGFVDITTDATDNYEGETTDKLRVLVISEANKTFVYRCVADGGLISKSIESDPMGVIFKTNVSINSISDDITICPDASVIFNVDAQGSEISEYIWTLPDASTLSIDKSVFELSSGNANKGVYTVEVVGVCANATAEVEILHYKEVKLITAFDSDVMCMNTGERVLSVELEGEKPFTYSWLKNNVEVSTNSTLTISNTDVDDAGIYQVLVTAAQCGSVSYIEAIRITNPVLVNQNWEDSYSRCFGTDINFVSEATGDNLEYKWYHDGVLIVGEINSILNLTSVDLSSAGIYKCVISNPECGSDFLSAKLIVDKITKITTELNIDNLICEESTDEIIFIDAEGANLNYEWTFDDGTGEVIVGENKNNYTLPLFTQTSEGKYKVELTGTCGVDSREINYTMIPLVRPISELEDVVVCEGSEHTLKVYYSGSITSYKWKLNGVVISGITGDTYTINTTIFGNDKTYTCEVTPICGDVLSSSAVVRVTKATKLINPLIDIAVCENNNIALTSEIEGVNLVYNWKYNGTPISEKTNTLLLNNITSDQAGLYILSVNGVCGEVITLSNVEVGKTTSIIKDLPSNIEICESEQLFVRFNVDGRDLKYVWEKDNYSYSKASSNFLDFKNIFLSDAGIYNVSVSGLCGDVSLKTEIDVKGLTSITGKLTNQSVCENQEVNLHVEARGRNLSYQWFKGSIDLNIDVNTLTIASVSLSDIGVYRCIVTGDCGQKETSAELNVKQLPVFINQPLDERTVCEETDIVTFSADLKGDDIVLQWRKDGVDIPGAIYDTYSISGIELSDDAEYTLFVKSACGDQIISNRSTLNVTPILRITNVSNAQELCINEELNIHVEAEGSNLRYQWRLNGVDIAGEIKSIFNILSVNESHSGIYDCIVEGECSAPTASRAIPVIVNVLPNASIFGRIDVCSGEERVVFQTGSVTGYTYNWEIDKGEFYDNSKPSKVSTNWTLTNKKVIEKGKLILNLVIDRTGCAAKIDSIIRVRPLPDVSVADMTPIGFCYEPVELTSGLLAGEANEGGIYWIDGISNKFFDPKIYGSGKFPIAYSFTDKWGCSNISDTQFLEVAKKPSIELIDNLILASCKTIQLDTLSSSGTLLDETVMWGNTPSLSNLSIYNPIFTPGETGIYTIEARDKYDCIAKDYIEIEVAPLPDVTTIRDTIVGQCGNLMLEAFTDTDNFSSINWSNADHLDNPQSLTPRLDLDVPVGTHNYRVDIVDVYGCESSNSVNVQIMADPELGVPIITGCEGEEFVVDLTDNPLARWVNLETNKEDLDVTDYPVRVINKVGQYKIIAKNIYECSDEQLIIIRSKPNLHLDLDLIPTPEKMDLFQKEMRSQGDTIFTIFHEEILTIAPDRLDEQYSPYTFEWTDVTESNLGDLYPVSIMPMFDVDKTGLYSLKVSDMPIDNKVCTSVFKFRVVVKPPEIISPNAFTPESKDGINDRFYQKDVHFVKDYELKIFARWGQNIFSTKEIGYAGGWNGRYNGKPAPLGSYTWMSFSEGKVINRGSFVLIR